MCINSVLHTCCIHVHVHAQCNIVCVHVHVHTTCPSMCSTHIHVHVTMYYTCTCTSQKEQVEFVLERALLEASALHATRSPNSVVVLLFQTCHDARSCVQPTPHFATVIICRIVQ